MFQRKQWKYYNFILLLNSNDENNFSHKSLLTDTQVLRIHIAFANGSSANIKFSKTQLFKMIQLGGFFTSDPLDVFGPLSLFKIINSKGNSYEKYRS